METLLFRKMAVSDWDDVAAIYKQGIETGIATFQENIPSWEEWSQAHLETCRLLAIVNDEIAGWAALSPVSKRPVYAGVAEVSLYIGDQFRGKKIGFKLLQELINESEKNNIWTLQAGIFTENTSSLALHEKAGFRRVGYREKIGRLNGKWHDTILMERRSKLVSND
jgi:L-amino acid N-acyltransferase YncA